MRFKMPVIIEAVESVYQMPLQAINKNAEAMDMLCLFTSMYFSKNKDASGIRLGISEAMFAKRVRTAKNRLEYQGLLPKAELIRSELEKNNQQLF